MKVNKMLCIIAGAAIALGAAASGVAIAMGAGRVDSGEKQTQTAAADISKINIKANADDIIIVSADTDKISLTYTTGRTKQYDFRVDGETLSLISVPRNLLNFKWYDYVSFNIGSNKNKIEMTVPNGFSADFVLENDYGSMNVFDVGGSMKADSDCGSVTIERCGFSDLSCDTDYGKLTLTEVSAGNVSMDSDCGDVTVEKCSFSDFSCDADYGKLSLTEVSAGNMRIDSDCGGIMMTDVTSNLKAYCNYGNITLDRFFGENIILENDCGNISGTILGKKEDYTIAAKTDAGENNPENRTGGVYNLNASVDAGSIDIRFLK